MSLITKLGLSGLIATGAGGAIPFAIRTSSSSFGPDTKYALSTSITSSPVFNSRNIDAGVKVFLELDSEHERYLNECRFCNKFHRRFKLKVVDAKGDGERFDRMKIYSNGAVRIIDKDYREEQLNDGKDVEMEQKLEAMNIKRGDDNVLVNLKDIAFETAHCKQTSKTVECELDVSKWVGLKWSDTTRPKMIFYPS